MARDQKFILAQLRDQHASDWLRVALRIPAVAEDGRAKGYDRLPPAQRERLLVLVLFLHGRLESPFKTQLRNLTHHRAEHTVVAGDGFQRGIGGRRRTRRHRNLVLAVHTEGRPANRAARNRRVAIAGYEDRKSTRLNSS